MNGFNHPLSPRRASGALLLAERLEPQSVRP
jgi:hypothetical protein